MTRAIQARGVEEPRVITDEELERVAARVRSIRRQELRAKLVGVAVALGLAVGLFAGTYLVIPAEPREVRALATSGQSGDTKIRVLVAALGFAVGAFVYTRLSPREHPDDVE